VSDGFTFAPGPKRDVRAVERAVVDAVEVQCGRLKRVEVLEVDEIVSPTSARMSGPWMPRSPTSLGIIRAPVFVNRR
jgi:hypothetical protein